MQACKTQPKRGTVPRGEKEGGAKMMRGVRAREGWRLQQLGWRGSRCRVSVCGCINAAGQGRYEQLKCRQGEECEPTANWPGARSELNAASTGRWPGEGRALLLLAGQAAAG
jgi:hypothetical protein